MRIAELSNRSGVPVPTIKYYLREGLLPFGRQGDQRNDTGRIGDGVAEQGLGRALGWEVS